MHFQLRSGLVFVAVVLAIILPRFLALDRFVTADEPKWLARSGNFYLALGKGDLANTFTREHPGVTVTWAGTAALLWSFPEYGQHAQGYLNDSRQVEPIIRDHGKQPLDVLAASRVFMVLLVTMTLISAFWSSVRLFGLWPSASGFFLLAFDPFHLGLSRLLHLDGLMSSLMLLSTLTFLIYFHSSSNGKTIYLVSSGIAGGLAWLTKSPAFFLVPFFGLVVALDLIRGWHDQGQISVSHVWAGGRALILWGLIGMLVFVLLWPAMWVNPVGTLKEVFAEANTYAMEGHATDVFFRGAVISSDPERVYNAAERQLYGPWAKVRIVGDEGRSFYLLSYLWRTTPLVLIGLALAEAGLVLGWKQLKEGRQQWGMLVLVLFAMTFTLFMTLGSKKFDRYLLPVFPPLDLLAGIGWTVAAGWVGERSAPSQARFAIGVVLVLVAFGQALGTLRTYPYYLSYYNPLMGGGKKAPQVMMVGWGEGLDQAARYLNMKPNSDKLKVMSWYPDGSFSYIFDGETVHAAAEWEQTIDRLVDADYVVVYIHQWQRQLPFSEMLAYFAGRTPEHVIRFDGINYAQIYRIQDAARR